MRGGWRRLWWGARPPREDDTDLSRSLIAVLDGDLDLARARLEARVRRDSSHVAAYLALARVYRQRGEIGRAIRVHQNLLLRPELTPEERELALYGLAEDFRRGGFVRRAIAAYEDLLASCPRHRRALRALIQLHRLARRPERALELARRLGRLEPDAREAAEAPLWVESARLARADGRTREALRALRRALRRDRDCVDAWVELGHLEAERGRSKRALRAWLRAAGLDRRAARRVYPLLESAYAAVGRARDFETWLREKIESDPSDADARLALARALAARGEGDGAIAELRRLLASEPRHREAHLLLGRILLAEQRDPEAVKAYAELLEWLEREPGALDDEGFA